MQDAILQNYLSKTFDQFLESSKDFQQCLSLQHSIMWKHINTVRRGNIKVSKL